MAYYKVDKLTKKQTALKKSFVAQLKELNKQYLGRFQKKDNSSYSRLLFNVDNFCTEYTKNVEFIRRNIVKELQAEEDAKLKELRKQWKEAEKKKKKTKK